MKGAGPKGRQSAPPKLCVGAPRASTGMVPKRFSVQRKIAIVGRLLRGEPLDLGGPANECLHRQANRGSTAGDHHRCQLELDGYTAPVTMVARSALPTFRSRALLLDLPLLLPLMLLTQPRVLLPHGGNEVFQFAVEVVLGLLFRESGLDIRDGDRQL